MMKMKVTHEIRHVFVADDQTEHDSEADAIMHNRIEAIKKVLVASSAPKNLEDATIAMWIDAHWRELVEAVASAELEKEPQQDDQVLDIDRPVGRTHVGEIGRVHEITKDGGYKVTETGFRESRR